MRVLAVGAIWMRAKSHERLGSSTVGMQATKGWHAASQAGWAWRCPSIRVNAQPPQLPPQALQEPPQPSSDSALSDGEVWWLAKAKEKLAAEAVAKANAAASKGAAREGAPGLASGTSLSRGEALLQYGQLAAVLAALLLLPVLLLLPDLIYSWRLGVTYLFYWLFFGASVQRQNKHRQLASRSNDKQTSTWPDRLQLITFVGGVVLLHWLLALRCVVSDLRPDTWYEVLAAPVLLAALRLHGAAVRDLGAAWDRVVAPPQLVTSGVYSLMQHPMYCSYTLCFVGCALFMHSAPAALVLLAGCALHFRRRAQLETEVLSGQFGEQYEQYSKEVPRWLPRPSLAWFRRS